jgi:hypothetical protein
LGYSVSYVYAPFRNSNESNVSSSLNQWIHHEIGKITFLVLLLAVNFTKGLISNNSENGFVLTRKDLAFTETNI